MLNALSASQKLPAFRAKLRGFGAECEGAAARLHLTIETISDQIPATQQSVVSLWGLYSADRPKADRDVQAAVADLKVQLYARVQENSNAASFFAPIRRLPVEVLAIWRLVATTIPR